PVRYDVGMTNTAFMVDEDVAALVAGWQRDLGAVRRLAANTLEAYSGDLGQFLNFLGQHTGGAVSLATLNELRAADVRSFMAKRRNDELSSRSLARALSALKSFFRFLEREGVVATEAFNVIRAPRQPRSVPKALTVS